MAYLDQDAILGITTVITDGRQIQNVVNVSIAGTIGGVGIGYSGDGSGLTIPASGTSLTNNGYQTLSVNAAGIGTINVQNGHIIGIALTSQINRISFTNVPTVVELTLLITQPDGSRGYRINWTGIGTNMVTSASVASTSANPWIEWTDNDVFPYTLFQDRRSIVKLKTINGGVNWYGRKLFDFYDRSTLAVSISATAFAAGTNVLGSFGLNDIVNRSSLTVLPGTTTWKQISSGKEHTLGIRTDGTLWVWGRNYEGQLGLGATTITTVAVSSPVQLGAFSNWDYVSAGQFFSLAINKAGQVYAFGSNGRGQLGDATTIDKSSPVLIVGAGVSWRQLEAGGNHCLGIRSDGTLWTWGANNVGQLGTNDSIDRSSPIRLTSVGYGTYFVGYGTYLDGNWEYISAGTEHNVAITFENQMFTWGRNGNGQLGVNDTTNRFAPEAVLNYVDPASTIDTVFGSQQGWRKAWCGDYNTFAINDSGILFGWGDNTYGQLGKSDVVSRSLPVAVGSRLFSYLNEANVYNSNWRNVSVPKYDGYHVAGVKRDGSLWVWGRNDGGELGIGDTTNRSTPTRVGVGSDWISVNTANRRTIALSSL